MQNDNEELRRACEEASRAHDQLLAGSSHVHVARSELDALIKERDELKAQIDQMENNEKECVAILRERTNIVGQSSSEIVNSLVRQLDAANKACAHLKNAVRNLEEIAKNNDISQDEFDRITLCADLACATDCGKGYHSDEEIKPLLTVLEDIATDDLDRVSGGVKQSAQQALAHAHARKLGFE